MPIDIHKRLPTDGGFKTVKRKDLNDLIVSNIVNAVNFELLRDVPEEHQLREMVSSFSTGKIGNYRASVDGDKIVIENGDILPFNNGDKIRFISPTLNSENPVINVNGIDYPFVRPNGQPVIGGEVQKDHEVLLEYLDGKFRIIPTSSAPLITMDIYQGPTEFHITTSQELEDILLSFQNKIIISDITVSMDPLVYNVTQTLDFSNIDVVNAKLRFITTVGTRGRAVITADVKSLDMTNMSNLVYLSGCRNITFEGIEFGSNFDRAIFIENRCEVGFIGCNFNSANITTIEIRDSNVYMQDPYFIVINDITEIYARSSNISITSATCGANTAVKTASSIFLYADFKSNAFIYGTNTIEWVAFGLVAGEGSQITAKEYERSNEISVEGPDVLTFNEVKYPILASFNSNISLTNIAATGGWYGALSYYDSNISIKYGNFDSFYTMFYSAYKSNINAKYCTGVGISYLANVMHNSKMFITNNTVTLNNTVFTVGHNSDIFVEFTTYTPLVDNFTFVSAYNGSRVSLNSVVDNSKLTKNTVVDRFSIVNAIDTDVGTANVRIGRVTSRGIVNL